MNILSIYQSLPSTVSLFQNDRIVAAVSEERFTRNKNDEAFPKESINYCLDQGGIKPENLDAVALASFTSPFEDQLVKKSRWSVADYLTEQYDRWKPFLIDKNHAELKSLLEIFPGKIETELYPQNFWSEILNDDDSSKAYLKNRTKLFSDYLDIPNHKIHKVDHHRAHAYYSYYTS